tara:strand:+ start:11197 stop:11346 length:150 start_codon:yes stop_codon:yes gene_type:complete
MKKLVSLNPLIGGAVFELHAQAMQYGLEVLIPLLAGLFSNFQKSPQKTP